jgi:hypothetical protein
MRNITSAQETDAVITNNPSSSCDEPRLAVSIDSHLSADRTTGIHVDPDTQNSQDGVDGATLPKSTGFRKQNGYIDNTDYYKSY